jgi:hypothetical protein
MTQAVRCRIRSRSDSCFIDEPDVLAGLADDDLEDLCYNISVELVVVPLVVDDNLIISVHRPLDDPRPEVATFRLSGEAPDCVVGWHDPLCLELGAYPVVP